MLSASWTALVLRFRRALLLLQHHHQGSPLVTSGSTHQEAVLQAKPKFGLLK